MAAQTAARAPRKLPEGTAGHVIMTNYGPVTSYLIKKLRQYKYSYVVLCPDLEEALKLSDMDIRVVVGELDDPETYRKLKNLIQEVQQNEGHQGVEKMLTEMVDRYI